MTPIGVVRNLLASAVRRRGAEEEAESTLRALAAVIEGTTDNVFVKDVDGRFIAVNASAAQTLGRTPEELIGHTLHEVLPVRIADAMAETDRLTLARGTVEAFEGTFPVGEGTRVFLTRKGPYCARDGTRLDTFGIAHDITERKSRESVAREAPLRPSRGRRRMRNRQRAFSVPRCFQTPAFRQQVVQLCLRAVKSPPAGANPTGVRLRQAGT